MGYRGFIPNDELRMTNDFCQSALTFDVADTCGVKLQWCLEVGVKCASSSEQSGKAGRQA